MVTTRRSQSDSWTRVSFGDVVRQVKDKVDVGSSGLDRYIAGEHMDTDDLRISRWGEIKQESGGPCAAIPLDLTILTIQVDTGPKRLYIITIPFLSIFHDTRML